jgi:tRNA dimethylallyltransferase
VQNVMAVAVNAPGEGYPLIAVVGPTSSGKSALALHLAWQFGGEIINCDSIQVYRGLEIGSGKVPQCERARIPHHLIDVLSINQVMTAGKFRRLARHALAEIRGRGRIPVLAGGTGLYMRSLLVGLFDGPQRSDRLRERLKEMESKHGTGFLHRMLARLDSAAASRIHPHDAQKLVRATEVCLLSGRPISELHGQGRDALTGYRVFSIGLSPKRAELYNRINQRVEAMFASGLVDEVRGLLALENRIDPSGPGPLNALGYSQALKVLRGGMMLPEAVKETQLKTRRYAKRQMTWFRRESGIAWFDGFGDDAELQSRIVCWLARNLPQASSASHDAGPRTLREQKGCVHEQHARGQERDSR